MIAKEKRPILNGNRAFGVLAGEGEPNCCLKAAQMLGLYNS